MNTAICGETTSSPTLTLIEAAQKGDGAAKERLVLENTGLVWSVVKRFAGRGHEAEDLFQIGSIGLIKSINKFDSTFGVKFSTYAVPMIIGEIRRFLRDDGMIKVARPLKTMAAKAHQAQEYLTKKNGKSPNLEDVAKELDIDVSELILALDAAREVESIYKTVNVNDENPIYLIDRIDAAEDSDSVVDKIALKEMISNLSEKERRIIILRYFRDMTQSDVGKLVGLSQVQVSRIENKVLKKLREKLS